MAHYKLCNPFKETNFQSGTLKHQQETAEQNNVCWHYQCELSGSVALSYHKDSKYRHLNWKNSLCQCLHCN